MGFRHKFAYSFFDFGAYKEFLAEGLGKSILYIFLVTLIFSTITNFKIIDTFNTEITNMQEALVHNIPNFELKNGEFSMDSTEPVYYKYDGDILIIDTVNKTSTSALDQYSNGIYINSKSIVSRQDYATLYTFNFSDYPELTLTNSSFQKILLLLKTVLPIILVVFNPLISFLLNLAAVFIVLGPVSIGISSIIGVKFNYSRACTLSFYAMTMPLFLEALLNISGIQAEYFTIIFYILTLGYCSLAIKEIKDADKSNINLTQ